MNCINCGAAIQAGAANCRKCGAAVEQPAQNVQQTGQAAPINVIIQSGPGVQQPEAIGEPTKSKIAAGLLGIFLGFLGIHRFYLGHTGIGIAQLLITVLTCGWGTIVTLPWGLIEGILILVGNIDRDASGRLLKD